MPGKGANVGPDSGATGARLYNSGASIRFEQIAMRLRTQSEFEHGSGAHALAIAEAEVQLGVLFPASYRRFLATFGWGSFADYEICGLGADVPDWLDIAKVTRIERARTPTPLPRNLLPIHCEGDGDQLCIDTREYRDGRTPVMFWSQDQGAVIVADDFIDWLAGLL